MRNYKMLNGLAPATKLKFDARRRKEEVEERAIKQVLSAFDVVDGKLQTTSTAEQIRQLLSK